MPAFMKPTDLAVLHGSGRMVLVMASHGASHGSHGWSWRVMALVMGLVMALVMAGAPVLHRCERSWLIADGYAFIIGTRSEQ